MKVSATVISVGFRLGFLALVGVCCARADVLPSLDMGVAIEFDKAQGHQLRIILRNNSNRSIFVSERNLPWLNINTPLVERAVIKSERKSELRQGGMFEDFLRKPPIEVRPGETLSGSLPLKYRFPTFPNDIRQHDIEIFWRCQLPATPVVCLNGSKGVLLVPSTANP